MPKLTIADIIFSARRVSTEALRKCSTPGGFVAGGHHFVDHWARDGFFATFGAKEGGLSEVTKKTIDTFISFQRKDGLIPYRVMRSRTTLSKYRGKPEYLSRPVPNFHTPQSGGLVLDGGLLVAIAAGRYFKNTKDLKNLKGWYPYLRKAMFFYLKRDKGLLSEWFQCEWADSVLKIGKVLYTNVLFWGALKEMAQVSDILNQKKDREIFRRWEGQIFRAINEKFWNGSYFSDWIDFKRQNYFASHANMLCIVLGLANLAQSKSILNFAKKNCGAGWTLKTNYPKYPLWRISFWNYLAGMGDYQNRGCLWLQDGILYALALEMTNKRSEAKTALIKVAEKIVEHDSVFEVYEKNGTPVRRLGYTSEHPFAWSAGLFLWAADVIKFK